MQVSGHTPELQRKYSEMLVDILIVYIILLQLEPTVQRHLRGYAHSFSTPDTMFGFPELARLEVVWRVKQE